MGPGLVPGMAWVRRLGVRRIAGWATVAMLYGAVHHRAFAELWHVWQSNDNYSHGPLVPLASSTLLWMSRERLRELPRGTSVWGMVLVALACLMTMVGVRGDVFTLQAWSTLIMLAGLSLVFLGPRPTRGMIFPLAFLVFMLPFPPEFVNHLSQALKEITVGVSTWAAELLGVTLRRSGMILYLAAGELHIDNPCSGLRSLLALFATGALFAYLQPGRGWRKAAILMATVPIAVAGNAVRTTLLVVVAHYADIETAGGLVHDLSGFVLYAVALTALVAVRRGLTPAAARPTRGVERLPA